MGEHKALMLLAAHRDTCRMSCPRQDAGQESDVDEFCPEGFRLIIQLIESDDDA